jgi:glycosyltransferase involved in cell wall biosynthesis
MVDAYADLRRAGRGSPSGDRLADVQLVLAGQAQWRESELYAKVRQSGLEQEVRFPGYVEEADLPALYSGALAFVYPSLYEGFGLPPLEAMACGAPVICSNAASLPEVVGDAALLVAPTDTSALAVALAQVVNQPGLAAELAAKGLRRAAQFTWQKCAAETLAVYRAAG